MIDEPDAGPGAAPAPAISWIVPTVGAPRRLARGLESIVRDAAGTGAASELIVVWQRPAAPGGQPQRSTEIEGGDAAESRELAELARRLVSDHPAVWQATRIVKLPRPAGFARAANAGIEASRGRFIALVNDDAVLAVGWTRALLAAFGATAGANAGANAGVTAGTAAGTAAGATASAADADPAPSPDSRIGSAQGINLLPAAAGDEARIDGAGLTWNCRHQAVQIDRGQPAPPPGGATKPVYGVSATAAVYRRDALEAATPGSGPLRPFNERLDSYYEDVELADRLHRASYEAVVAPAARVEHAGAMSSRGRRAARRRARRIYSNRLLVLAARLGRSFWLRLPGFLLRDAVDLLRGGKGASLPGDPPRPGAVDLLFAWGRAVRLLPHFAGFRRAQPVWRGGDSGNAEEGG